MVYQEKNKSKWSKDGRKWYYRCYYEDIYGNRKQKQSKLFETKKEAQEEERLFLLKLNNNIKDILFEELTIEYLKDYKKKNKESTYYDTKNRIDKHIIPIFKNIYVSKINIQQVELFKEKIEFLNIRTQNSIITYFKSILRFGIEKYDLNIPVIHKIKTIPKGIQPPKSYNVWDTNEFATFINQVDDTLYKALFITLYFTGMRIGELQALKWNDLNQNIISISKSCNKNGIVTTPKTSNSYRDIDIPTIVIETLNDLYKEKQKIYNFNKEMFIFGDVKVISRTTITRAKDYYTKKANIKRITIHEFRHSHVTLLRDMGYSIKQVAERIGDTETTVINTYSHLFENKKFTISEGLNNIKL